MVVSGAGDSERKLGRYHLVEPIGGGPTGESFRAKVYGVAGFERQFAVKRFHRELVKRKPAAEAIARAARVYGNLEHPRIARMQEFGVAGGETFAATEMVEGIDASRLLGATHGSGAPPPIGAIVVLALQAARAVGYAHGRGIEHLGVCPTNIICCADGELKVTDFGFLPPRLPSKPADDFTLLARLPYLAPEQLLREGTSAATDVFQLGVVAYELLTGARPFQGPTPLDISHAILSANPPPPEVPRPLVKVLFRALARSPFERYPDASALADGIEAAMRESSLPGGTGELAVCVRAAVESVRTIESQANSGAFAFPMPAPPLKIAETPLARAIERGATAPGVPLAVAAAPRRTVLGMAPVVPRPMAVSASVPPPIPRASRTPEPPRVPPTPQRPPEIPAMPPRQIDEDAPTNVLEGGINGIRSLGSDTGLELAPTQAFDTQPADTIAEALADELLGPDDGLDLDDFPPTPLPPSLPDLDESSVANVPPPPRSRPVSSLPPNLSSPPRAFSHDDRPIAADVPSAELPVAEVAAGRGVPRKAILGAVAIGLLVIGGVGVGVRMLGDDGAADQPRPPVHGRRGPVASADRSPPPASASQARQAVASADPLATAAALAGNPTPVTGAPGGTESDPTAALGEPPPAADRGPIAAELPPEPPPAVAPLGKLVIRTEPAGARIYLDGTSVGKSPETLDSTDDSHRLAVVLPGYELHTADIEGEGELAIELVEVTPPAGRGGIKVRCRAKNRYYVFLDGKHTGQLCPTERLGADLGEHMVEIYDPVTDSRHSFRANVDQTRLSKRIRVD